MPGCVATSEGKSRKSEGIEQMGRGSGSKLKKHSEIALLLVFMTILILKFQRTLKEGM